MPTAGEYLRVATEWDMPQEQKAYNVFGFNVFSGECTDAELLTAMAAWLTTVYGNLQAAIANTVDIQESRVAKVTWSGTKWVTDRIIGIVYPTFTASNVNDMLPHAVAALATHDTTAPKRKGKVYIPGFAESEQDESYLTGAAITAMANMADDMQTALTPGTATVYYVVLGDDGYARGSTAYSVPGVLSSQRRRKPGVGI